MTDDLIDIIRLIGSDGIGAVSFTKYVKKFGSVSAALSAVSIKKTIMSLNEAREEIEYAQKKGIKIISYQDNKYPQKLLEIYDYPPILYALGDIDLLNYDLCVAVVGARNASIGGRKLASKIAYDLTENNVLVVSGMARGIDAAAHKGAMYAKNKSGPTIAVLGTGVDVIYPEENRELYADIAKQGVVISEFMLKTPAQIGNFPRRNRIISALSYGTLVVEATEHSGSLITAQSALEQGKDVFAVPGSPADARSAGPNKLIKEGAILTQSAADILDEIKKPLKVRAKNKDVMLLPLDKAENNVNISEQYEDVFVPNEACEPAKDTDLLQHIGFDGVEIDELLRSVDMEQSKFFEKLLELEFEGVIVRTAGNKVVRVK